LDPVGGLCLEAEDFTEVTAVVQSIAQEHAGGKLVSLLEGGYHLEHMPASALCHVRALAETQL
jgi:acetoin utilization deacetylase AcuC-like enzyme